MSQFEQFWVVVVDFFWGLPLVVFILTTGIYFAYISRLKPLAGFFHAFAILTGKYDRKDEPGEVPHFQALTVALSGTIGMGNIAGVAIAISLGGAGAIFWMWVAGSSSPAHSPVYIVNRMKMALRRVAQCIL